MYLFFDTETTGKCHFNAHYKDECQPHLAQLGAILTDENGIVRGELNVLIRPDGWTMPAEVAAIHGITTELCEQYGVGGATALKAFTSLCGSAQTMVAHNIEFDRLILSTAAHRIMGVDPVFPHEMFCTMKSATPICKLPGRYGYKWPNLQEAHTHFFGRPFESAHDAMADVRACMRVFFEMKKLGDQ